MSHSSLRFNTRNRLIAGAATILLVGASAAVIPSAAEAQNNGVGRTPAMGWSSWSFLRANPTAAKIEVTADAMKNSGLVAAGYKYVNVDDFWYQCPGSQGPNVDANGRWVTDETRFPAAGAVNGIQVVATYVHNAGLKFGLYVTPGVSSQAVAAKSKISGTNYTVDQIATTGTEKNYNCKGMVGIDYTKPGAQEFINSWANQFAGWGVDYLKMDGVGTWDLGDLKAWSAALRQTGRPIHLELSNGLALGSAATWQQYSNGWRAGGDIECYCGGASSYPLTRWSHVFNTFDNMAKWQPYGGPGGWNDYDSLELGNGNHDGLTVDERRTMMTQLAMGSAPLLLGSDLTNLDPADLVFMKNSRVIGIDQDGVAAVRLVNNPTSQVFSKREKNGAFVIALFNTDVTTAQNVSVSLPQAGLTGSAAGVDQWSGASIGTVNGTYTANVPAGGVQLVKFTAAVGTGGTSELVGAGSGTCLDVFNNLNNPGTKVEIWGCNGGLNQEWTRTASGELRVNGATTCLDVVGGATAPGSPVVIQPCTGAASQGWTVNANGTIVAKTSKLCLDVPGAKTANGTPIQIWTCNGGANQKWTLR